MFGIIIALNKHAESSSLLAGGVVIVVGSAKFTAGTSLWHCPLRVLRVPGRTPSVPMLPTRGVSRVVAGAANFRSRDVMNLFSLCSSRSDRAAALCFKASNTESVIHNKWSDRRKSYSAT